MIDRRIRSYRTLNKTRQDRQTWIDGVANDYHSLDNNIDETIHDKKLSERGETKVLDGLGVLSFE